MTLNSKRLEPSRRCHWSKQRRGRSDRKNVEFQKLKGNSMTKTQFNRDRDTNSQKRKELRRSSGMRHLHFFSKSNLLLLRPLKTRASRRGKFTSSLPQTTNSKEIMPCTMSNTTTSIGTRGCRSSVLMTNKLATPTTIMRVVHLLMMTQMVTMNHKNMATEIERLNLKWLPL